MVFDELRSFYKQVTLNRDSIATVQKAIATATLEWEEGRLYNQITGTKRMTDVAWVMIEIFCPCFCVW